jgi:FKBP-type peptidyl-prolyl cis-trans isomerase FkpA
MNLLLCALSPLVPVVILPLLMEQAPASAAPVRSAHHARTVSAPIRPTTDIIPLPLSPVLPAGQRVCAARTASGLGYTMLRSATGAKPGGADIVLVNYIGYLAATGAVFDQGMKSALQVNGVIPGFAQGLQMLAKTGIGRFCIPAAMGYGAQASGPIPANSDLVFQVELVDFKTASEVEAMRKAQATEPGAPTGADAPAK